MNNEFVLDNAGRIRERLIRFTRPSETGCREWTGAKSASGYAVISLKLAAGWRTTLVSRLVLALGGKIDISDSSIKACHHCDNPACVEEFHLFPGSQKDNLQDAARKGRIRMPRLFGVYHPRAKLSEDQVRSIRASVGPQRKVAQAFGVTKTVVAEIRTGKRYKSVN